MDPTPSPRPNVYGITYRHATHCFSRTYYRRVSSAAVSEAISIQDY